MKTSPYLLIALAFVLAGCGGSGSSGGSAGTNNSTQPSSTVRRNETGDTYNYSIGGTYTQNGVPANTPATGSGTDIFTADTYDGMPALQDAVSWTLNLVSGQQTFTDTQQFDSAWVAIGQSDMGTMETIMAQGEAIPGTLTSSTTINAVEILANNTHVTVNGSVTGFGMVTTPAGTFNCWTIQLTKTWSDGLTIHQTISFSPDIGSAVQIVQTDSNTNGYSDAVTWTLTSDQIRPTP